MKSLIQRVLVPLDPSPFARAATLRACQIAKAHGSEITGVTVLDTPGIRSQVAPLDTSHWFLVQDIVRKGVADARQRISKMEQEFARLCAESQVPHRVWELEGVPAQLLLDAAGLHDLVVVGMQTFFHFETHEKGESLAKLLRRTATPILAVPAPAPESVIRRVTIAYDGSMNAARTLREFAAFSQPFEHEITVVSAHESERFASKLLEEAVAYLRSHGLEHCAARHLRKKTLVREDLGSPDLIVAGIHSQRFLQDLVMGSFAAHLIELGDTPLFLSH